MDEQAPDKTPATEPAPDSVADESKLGVAKQKLASLAEKAKEHDFKGDARKAAEGVKNLAENLKQRDFKEDARKAAEGVKNLKESLKKHDFKAELRDAFAETKKNPASLWKKPETLRPGKDLAIVGLAASVVLLLLLLVTSSSFLGLVCLVLGLGALLFSALGLKTEGRKLAVGGSVVGLLVVLCALGQTFGSSNDGEDAEEGTVASADAAKPAETTSEKSTKANETASASAAKPADKPIPPPMAVNEGQASKNVNAIFAAAEKAARKDSLNCFGFYIGMSAKDAKALRDHYGLNEKQLPFRFNKKSGEVYQVYFTPKAFQAIKGWPNNLETVSARLLAYFGIVEWNNEKEVIRGEVEAIFQDDVDRMINGDASNVPRQYVTADGILAQLYPKGWESGKIIFEMLDSKRKNEAIAFNEPFDSNNRMRAKAAELRKTGVRMKLMQLPHGFELLLQEDEEHKDGLWISALPVTESLSMSIVLGPAEKHKFGDRLAREYNSGIEERKGSSIIVKDFRELSDEYKKGMVFSMLQKPGEEGIRLVVEEAEHYAAREAERKAKEEAAKKAKAEADKIQAQKDAQEKKTIFEQKMVPENNARIDAVKPVLDAAKIETKEIEIRHGVRILMTHVDTTIGDKKIDWVSTFEVTEAQFAAVAYDGIRMIQLKNVPNGAAPHWFLDENSADIFTSRELTARGWKFRVPSAEEWEFIAGESIQGSSLTFKPSTLQDRIQGKRLDELVDTRKSWERPKWNDVGKERCVGNENNFSPVGLADPNYFGLYDMLGNAAEIRQPKDVNEDRRKTSGFAVPAAYTSRIDGALRLFATYTPPQPATTAPAPNPAPAAAKNDNAQ